MPTITAPGLGSGIDVESLVTQLVAAERAPTSNRLNLQEVRTNSELSALGRLKSALAEFQDAAAKLTTADGFNPRKTSVSDEDVLTATATGSAVQSRYEVEVVRLAEARKLTSGAYADTDAIIGSGTLSFTVDGETLDIEVGTDVTTLGQLRDAINAADDNPGVTAAIVNAADGAHLVLTSKETGVANAVTVTSADAAGGLENLLYDPGGAQTLTETVAPVDAEAVVEGFTVNSATNRIDGVLDGITLELYETRPGETVVVDVSSDTEATSGIVEDFVAAWNDLNKTFDELTAYDQESGVAGALLGDATLRSIESELRLAIQNPVTSGGTFQILNELGITAQVDGTLEIDSERMDAVLASDFDDVGRLFYGDDGLATRLDAIANRYTEDSGPLKLREDGLNDRLDDIEDQRDTLDLRMEQVEERYRRQFAALDQLTAQLQSTSSFLLQQLSQL